MDTKKKLAVKCAVMETKFGDRFVIVDSFLNWRGEEIKCWHTERGGNVTATPEWLEKAGYKIVRRYDATKVYALNNSGEYFEVCDKKGGAA